MKHQAAAAADGVVCTPPDGYELTYHLCREAWYAQPPVGPLMPEDRTVVQIVVQRLDGRGGLWEFAIDEERHGGLRVKVYDEAWQAFTAIPEFFAALAEFGRGTLVDEVVEVLDSLGFRDATQRVPADDRTRAALDAHAAGDASPAVAALADTAGGQVPEECEAWSCDGSGWSQQGTSYKSGEAEAQYAPCGRPCGRPA
jgi:hypothetical protein